MKMKLSSLNKNKMPVPLALLRNCSTTPKFTLNGLKIAEQLELLPILSQVSCQFLAMTDFTEPSASVRPRFHNSLKIPSSQLRVMMRRLETLVLNMESKWARSSLTEVKDSFIGTQ